MTVLLLRSTESDPTCTVGVTNFEAGGTVAFADYPGAVIDNPCGPFAAE